MPDIKIIIARYPLVAILVCSFMASNFPDPVRAQVTASEKSAQSTTEIDPSSQEDEFYGWQSLSAGEMSQYNGGTEITIGDIGVNLANNSASLIGNSVAGNVETGQIQNLNLNDVGGITSLMLNTGNNVSFQSNIQINIFVK